MKFTCVGFDIREWPWNEAFFAGENGWPRNEEVYVQLVNNFELKENRYQFLDIHDQKKLFNISYDIKQRENCNLIAVELASDVVKLLDDKYDFKTTSNTVEINDFICRGYDVCDVNGFFTIFHSEEFDRNELIPESQISLALETVQLANIFDRNHCPYIVAKVYSLK